MKVVVGAFLMSAMIAISGCQTPVGANEFRRGEIGEISRVEEGVVLSVRYVNIRGMKPLFNARRSRAGLGITYVVRLDKTGETLSVTQGSDVALGAGARIYVEFGDRIRVIPGPQPR
jgi:hypothetical protein